MGNNLTSVIIPNSVTIIGAFAFRDNDLTNVTIGNSVNTIGFSVFSLNTSLISVVSLRTDPAILNATIFSHDGIINSNGTIDLTIPSGATANYIAKDWTGFKSIMESTTLSTNEAAFKALDFVLNSSAGTLEVTNNNNIKITQLHVLTIVGKLVKNSATSSVNIANLATGIYIIAIKTDKGIATKKIIKK